MKRLACSMLPVLLLAGCLAGCATPNSSESAQVASALGVAPSLGNSLPQARRGFKTSLRPQQSEQEPAPKAPARLFRTIKYPAAPGPLVAYLSPDPRDGKKHPAILWITGGDCNSIGDVWTPASPANDQTAAAYRKAGIVMMFPSLRGGNDNPGQKEGFLGEVDDVLAAAKYLEKQPYVDPRRLYLGGHSTGGTLALLVAECSLRFRGVFAFGPAEDVSGYGAHSGLLPFDLSNPREVELRSPIYWLASIQSPTWVLEGSGGNIDSLRTMARTSVNLKAHARAHFIEIRGASHYTGLAPTNALIARKIMRDTGAAGHITLSAEEVNRALVRQSA